MQTIKKAYAITDAKISFVSLVDKAANRRKFLITKAENGVANFSTYGKIIKADADTHFVTGIVYEPMVEDSHGNYMTEDEIAKAFLWYVENGNEVDLQHNFEPLENATVVENWIAKADFELNGEPVTKGTWLMTVKVTDSTVWEKIEKGELSGFSMGGVGHYSEEDVDLSKISKESDRKERKGLLKLFGEFLGFHVVEKGELAELYDEEARMNNFWTANHLLQDILFSYNYRTDRWELEADEEKIREALSEFNQIVTQLLTSEGSIVKALAESKPVEKAGKALSGKNKDALQKIHDDLGAFLQSCEETDPESGEGNNTVTKEDHEMTNAEIEKIVTDAIAKALNPTPAEPAVTPAPTAPAEITADMIEKMVEKAVAKALNPDPEPEPEEELTADDVQDMITKAVGAAIEPLLKSRGLPSNLNGTVQKSAGEDVHYMHGIL